MLRLCKKKVILYAVIFEVQPKTERFAEYLAFAKSLRPRLDEIDGFVSVERFESRKKKQRLLSLSLWEDEASLIAWREQKDHRDAQARDFQP